MPQMIDTTPVQEYAIIIGVILKNKTEIIFEEYLDELEFLIETAGGITKKRFTQKLEKPDTKTYIGSGKLNEIKEYIKTEKIDIAVFDDELSPAQLRNIELELECKILDRTNLILDIFAKRARTSHAITQVELAQYQYLLPRLTGMWTHLSKQRGGIGMKGPGEKEIETDRRVIRDRIALLKEKLIDIDKQKATQRGNRGKMVRVALVGYTNVGKSTLMNLLSKSSVFAEDKLFATLDTTVRKVVIKNLPFLLSDTVGFIRKLPHHLIESFKSTLDEIRESDIIIHVVDISHPFFNEQIDVVRLTLREIDPIEKPVLIVYNKIDEYKNNIDENDYFNDIVNLENTWMAKDNSKSVFISAKYKTNIENLKDIIYGMVKEIHTKRYPYEDFLF
jgi:GTP-binding protein HflX